ncbi:MAG: hypothetical protein QG600_492 [Patescibacteria group bacterium]|nr:hypothetical protein [Patescibacteria group bacterium]
MLNFNSIMIGSSQPEVLASFYANFFAKEADMQDGNWWGWQVGGNFINIGEHSEITGKAKEPQRIILNLETSEINQEYERISKIENITVVKELYEMEGMNGMWIATFADPDGNYLQLMTPWEG